MKNRLIALFLGLLFCLGGCVSQDTTKLQVGMTKDEVVSVMGSPNSAGADGSYEYFNYRISTTRSGGGSTYISPMGGVYTSSSTFTSTESFVVKFQDGRVIAYGNTSQVGPNRPVVIRPASQTLPKPAVFKVISQSDSIDGNGVKILSIAPQNAVVGKDTEFKVRIAYSLKEETDGCVAINLNIIGPSAFTSFGSQVVGKGSGELEAIVKTTPKDWGQFVPFSAQAILLSSAVPHEGKPLAVSKREITLAR